EHYADSANSAPGRLSAGLAYANPPHFRPRLEVVPGELAGLFGLELIEERKGVVVVDELEPLARRQALPAAEDRRVAIPGRHLPDVQLFVCHLVKLLSGWSSTCSDRRSHDH